MSVMLDSISKVFKGQQTAVNNFSLEIDRGEIICLLGPSGCGKTTTLRLIAGFEWPTGGSLYIEEREVAGSVWVPPEKRKIGMVFQDYALFPHLNVFQNISFGLNTRNKEIFNKINHLIQTTGLKGLENRFSHQLSGGQQQRVSLARALARNPAVLLLDEPFSNLDALLRQNMREEIKSIIKTAGLTSLFVTHDLHDALAVADRIVVMKDGEIQQVGKPWDVYNVPGNTFVASFLNRFSLVNGMVLGKDHLNTGFGEVHVQMDPGMRKGQRVYMGIPPEAIKINDDGIYSGTIKYITYLGNKWEVCVEANFPQNENSCTTLKAHCIALPAARGQVNFNLDTNAVVMLYN